MTMISAKKARVLLAIAALMGLGWDSFAGNASEADSFLDAIWPAFARLADAAADHADAMNGLVDESRRPAVYQEFDDARLEFRTAVEKNWPFPIEDVSLLAAEKAYKEARLFYKEEYRHNRATREEVIERYVAVAEAYPETPFRDKALFMAAMACIHGYNPRDPRDQATEAALLRRLLSRPGPPSHWSIAAEEELAGHDDDPAARMRNRSEFYLSAEKRRSPEWLKANLLVPTGQTSPKQHAESVTGLLVRLRAGQYTSCRNMVGDAMGSSAPLESLYWLKQRHRGDPFVEEQLAIAAKRLLAREPDGDPEIVKDLLAVAESPDAVPAEPTQEEKNPRDDH